MASTRRTKLELQIMEVFWARGACSVREVQEAFPEIGRPAYTTIQTVVFRLETKGAVRVLKRISNAKIFESAISRDEAQSRLVDELLALLGGKTKPVMAHLVKTGQLTMADIQDAERMLRRHQKERKRQ